MSLKEELEKRKEELPSCVKIGTRDSAPFVEFHVTPHSRSGFPIGQLCHYTLESNPAEGDEPPERLTLAFPTADVVIVGARLGKLVEAVNDRALAAVMPLDARHAGTLGKQPWVAKVMTTTGTGCFFRTAQMRDRTNFKIRLEYPKSRRSGIQITTACGLPSPHFSVRLVTVDFGDDFNHVANPCVSP